MTAPARTPLVQDEIHLWCAFPSEISDAALLREYDALLSCDERQRHSAFVFARDRHRFLVTRAVVRTVLSRYAAITPPQWRFEVEPLGRPTIANADAEAQGISFNISHSHDLIVLAIAASRALGVDTENVRTREAPFDVARRVFAPDEIAALEALPEAHRPRRFFEYWTLKEAYVKARATGLGTPLSTFSFRHSGDQGLTFRLESQDESASRWLFWQIDVAGGNLIAVCAERIAGTVPRLVVRRIVPLVGESPLAHHGTRMWIGS